MPIVPRHHVQSSCLLTAMLLAGCASSGASVRALDPAARADQQASTHATAQGEQALAGRAVSATLAVLPFEPADTAVDELAIGFAELLISDLGRFPGLRLLERVRLDDVLHEQGLDTMRIDPASAVRAGRIIAAQQLVRGTVASEGDTAIRFDVGLIDVTTSDLVAAYAGAARADAIFAAERLVVQRLARALGLEVPPELDARMAERARFAPSAFRAFARGARQEAEGDLTAAAESYASAVSVAPSFELAQNRSAAIRRDGGDRAKGSAARLRRVPRVARPRGARPPA